MMGAMVWVYSVLALAWLAGAWVLRGHAVAVLCCYTGIFLLALARRELTRR